MVSIYKRQLFMTVLNNINKVHLIGIGGIGVSAVAKLLLHNGISVTGSDTQESMITQELAERGIIANIGHNSRNFPSDADMVIRSSAVPDDNPELAVARTLGVPEYTYFQFLGEYAKSKKTIAVTGTHGKSSVTAMLGEMLAAAGMDPTVIVGTRVSSFSEGNFRPGWSDLFVVEACEHEAHLLEFKPYGAIVNNIEPDHLDYYRDIDHIREVFQQFAGQVQDDGILVINDDDKEGSAELAGRARSVSVGLTDSATYKIESRQASASQQRFTLMKQEQELGSFDLQVPGRFNVKNAAMAAAMALELGASVESVRQALELYEGIWRRFEIVGKANGATLISDYGHHPTAVSATLEAVRESFLDRRIVLLFQPHHHNRTRNLFEDFVKSFDLADEIILPEIYDVVGREEKADAEMSSEILAEAVRERDRGRNVERGVHFAEDLDKAAGLMRNSLAPNSVMLIMGAGDVDRLARAATTAEE